MRASRETLQKVYDDIPSRTATSTIDAKLQAQASQILKEAARRGKAAAAVVLDADTGQVLARAQWPDFDPGSERFMRRLTDPDFPVKDKKFTGVYGPWPDKTGTRGVFQAGSVAKVVTSLIAARAGLLGTATQRVARTGPVFPCKLHDGQGPYFTRPGWYKAIHDHPDDPMHGDVEYIRGIAVSCNVYFGQLGLQLGPDAFKQLVADGVEIGWDGKTINPGKAGSRELAETAFGQAAALMSVSQLARVGATVAGGGIYRKCGPGMDKDLPCEERKIVNDPNMMVPILSGMESVVLAGTARGLPVPPGVRLYGKTGTADAIGTRDEIVFGVPYNEWGPPNSWFLGIAETAEVEPDQALTPRRLVTAVVVPRGGLGARTAGPAAMQILAAAQSLGYITKPAAAPGQAGAAVPGGQGASPAPTAPGAKATPPVTILAPVLATPTPSPRPPGVPPVAASPAAGSPPAATPAARPSPPAAPASAPVSPAPAGTPPAAATTPPPAPAPQASPSPAPPG
jgi:peptidoglycan glycosyltransferase